MNTYENIRKAFEAYRDQAAAFAEYRDERYPYAGLVAECGELFDVTAKFWRGDYMADSLADRYRDEAGDVAWMINAIAVSLGREYAPLFDDHVVQYTVRHRMEHDSTAFASELTKAARELFEEAVIYNTETFLPGLLGKAIAAFWGFLDSHDLDADDVLECNLAKLHSRKQAGTIKGAGHGAERVAHKGV